MHIHFIEPQGGTMEEYSFPSEGHDFIHMEDFEASRFCCVHRGLVKSFYKREAGRGIEL